MPIYEYECCQCKSQFEFLQRGEETPQCPKCGSRQLDKQFSVPAAHAASGQELPMCSPGGCSRPDCRAL